MFRRSLITVASLVAALAAAQPASAVVKFWTGAGGNNLWSNANNWSPAGAPTGADDAVCTLSYTGVAINITGLAACRTMQSTWPVVMLSTAQLTCNLGGILYNGMWMVANGGQTPFFTNGGQLDIYGPVNWYGGFIRQNSGGQINLKSTAVTTITGPNLIFEGGGVSNEGVMTVNGPGFTLGNYYSTDPLTVLYNASIGVIEMAGGSIYDRSFSGPGGTHQGGPSVLLNDGTFRNSAGAANVAHDVQFSNHLNGLVEAGNATISIVTTVNLDAFGTLTGSYWWAHNAGTITFGRPVNAIAANTAVVVTNSGSAIDQMYGLNTVNGALYVQDGAVVYAGVGGSLSNHGFIQVSGASTLNVSGTYLQGADGSLQREIYDAAGAAAPAVFASGSAILNGNLGVDIVNDSLLTPGARFPIVSSACCAAGQFASVSINTSGSAPTLMQYGFASADVRVPPLCTGDLNNDGQVNTADLTILLVNFGLPVTANFNGDLTGDGFVNTQDLAIFLSRFGTVCP